MGLTALFPAAVLVSSGQVLPQSAVLLRFRVDPRVERFHPYPHPCVLGELDRQPAGDLVRGPPLLQVFDHPVHEPVTHHPVWLVRAPRPPVGLELRLPAQIQPLVRAPGIQPVPQIRAQIRVIMLGLPRPTLEFPRDRGAMHPDPAGDLRLVNPQVVESLDLDPVIQLQVPVPCHQEAQPLHAVI